MVITYLGKQFFKITQGDLTIAINPISKDSDHKESRFGADIVLVTTNHKDFNGVEMVTFGEKEPFVLNGPGSYEIKNIPIDGVGVETIVDKKTYINTVYTLIVDGITLGFIGHMSQDSEISPDVRELLSTTDVLFVPIGGEGTLDFKKASKLAVSTDTKFVIPMDYGTDRTDKSLPQFLKEMGQEGVKVEDKLILKKKDLDGKEAVVFVLESVK